MVGSRVRAGGALRPTRGALPTYVICGQIQSKVPFVKRALLKNTKTTGQCHLQCPF